MNGKEACKTLMAIFDGLQTILVAFLLTLYTILRSLVPTSWLPHKSIDGHVILITGAGNGIGRLMSIEFARLGGRLVLWDLDENGNEETARKIREEIGGYAKTYTIDLTKRESIYETAESVVAEVGEVDILVNNAGVVTGKPLLDSPDQLIQLTMDVNTMAHFWTIKAFLPRMMERNQGHIVSIASISGVIGSACMVDYCTSKFAAVSIMDSLALEMYEKGRDGVKTTIVCPGPIDTGMFMGSYHKLMPFLQAAYVARKVVQAVLMDSKRLMLPRQVYLLNFMKRWIPSQAGYYVGRRLRFGHFMDNFVGRKCNKKQTND